MDVGLKLKIPSRIRHLEKGCPGKYYWLQGFGMEELEEPDSGKTVIFYPIWGFQPHFKCYELKKQEFEFVAGIRKCYQFSVEGMSENPQLNTLEDIYAVERTPVHEVVDLGDSDDEEPVPGTSNINDDSVMMIDSDSEHTEDGSDEEEDDDDEDDEAETSGLLASGILEVEDGEENCHGTGDINEDILDEDDDEMNLSNEPIEIPSSSGTVSNLRNYC